MITDPNSAERATEVVDGGYFENSAATTAYEIATHITDWCAFKKITNVDVKVIMISNDPRKPPIGPAKPQSELPGRKHTEFFARPRSIYGRANAPFYMLLNTRDARGTYAQKAIGREQRLFKADVVAATVSRGAS